MNNKLRMSSKTFRVRYWLQSMETRSSPLFSTVRAYLLTESLKRLIAESAPIKNGRLVFQAQLEEEARNIVTDGRGGYAEGRATVLLEFGAQGRFIKMGEAHVDLADVLNSGRNGEVLPYRVEKCYDRNARISLGVTLWQLGGSRLQKNEEMEMHSRSHCQLPPSRVKLRSAMAKNKAMATQYEQMTDREQREQQMSLVSDRHNSIGRTLNRTELLLRKPNVQAQEVLDLKTENRIYQHQMAQMEQRLREAQEQVVELRQQDEACRREMCRLGADCEALRGELQDRDSMKQVQKEQLSAEVARMLKLYQESEMERNKLLLLREEESSRQKERLKENQRRNAQDKNKVKLLQRSEESLKKRIEEYMSQIAIYDKALKTEQKSKEKLGQALDQQMKINASLSSEVQFSKQSCQKLAQTNSEIQSQLQISRFSFTEMEKELSLVRRTNKDLQQKLADCEAELKLSAETMRTQRSNFSKKLQKLQEQTQRQHRNMEAYIEELQIKTSKEQTKNEMIVTLRKEVGRLKQGLASQRQRVEELQGEIQIMNGSGKQLENKIQEYQTKILNISRENALLQSQVNSRRERLQSQPQQQQKFGLSEQQRQELIAQSYQQRDQVWKKQLQALQNDARTLMEKSKRQKDEHTRVVKKLNEDIAAYEDSLKKSKAKINDLVEEQERLKKNIKQLQAKCQQSQRNNSELKIQSSTHQHQILQLQKKLQCVPQLQESLREAQQKIASNKQQYATLKGDNQKQKQFRVRIRAGMKELISTASNYLGKSQKQRIFYDELHCEHIDAELLLLFNSSCKLYCDKHNRIRTKLQQLQELRGQLESKEKEVDKINKSLRDERRSQGGSCDSVSSINFSQRPSNASRALQIMTAPVKSPQRDDLETRTLRKQVQDLKSKLKKQVNRSGQLQRESERLRRNLQECAEDVRRIREEADCGVEELSEVRERLKGKEKQLQSAKSQLKQMGNQVGSLKHELQQVSRAFKQEKRQTLKRSNVNRSFASVRSDRPQQSLRAFELQRKLRQAQDQLQKLKREKDDRRSETSSQRQTKSFEARLKEKDDAIAALRENLEEQRQRSEQAKELMNLKMRKMKEEMEQEIELRVKAEKQAMQSLAQSQQKLRQVQKKLKITEQSLKNANSQLLTSIQREQKAKKMTAGEWQLKLKTSQGQFQGQIGLLNKKIDQMKISQRAVRDGERRKEKELAEARLQLQKSERAVAELSQRLQLCGVRLKNMEAEQSNYKQVIGALQSKIKGESQESRRQRQVDRDTFDNHSTFSLKTFTFR